MERECSDSKDVKWMDSDLDERKAAKMDQRMEGSLEHSLSKLDTTLYRHCLYPHSPKNSST